MKKYLKVKVEHLSVTLQDTSWGFYKDTIFVFESVGWLVEYIAPDWNRKTEYISKECIRLNKIIYDKLVEFHPETRYEITEIEPNVINADFHYNYGAPYYKNLNCNAELIMNDIDILNELFEDVSLEYNREEKITNLLD